MSATIHTLAPNRRRLWILEVWDADNGHVILREALEGYMTERQANTLANIIMFERGLEDDCPRVISAT